MQEPSSEVIALRPLYGVLNSIRVAFMFRSPSQATDEIRAMLPRINEVLAAVEIQAADPGPQPATPALVPDDAGTRKFTPLECELYRALARVVPALDPHHHPSCDCRACAAHQALNHAARAGMI